MKGILLALLASIVAVAQTPNTLTPKEVAEGWILLWDGEATFGWESHGAAEWKIAGSALVAESAEGGWLGTTTPFADFVLKLEFRTAADGNSGVFLRSARTGAPHQTGYELQIYDTQPAGYNTGSLVNYAKAPTAKIVPGRWNNFEVTAEGDHFVVAYNGKKVLDARDAKHAMGVIGLQYTQGKKIEFRNLKLRPLDLKPIFNGKDLSGWAKVDRPNVKAPPEWSVRDGAIHVEKGPGQLETEGAWDDLVLQLDVRTNAQSPTHHPNSGVFFRGAKGQFWSGYESQIRNEYKEGNRAAPVDFGTGGVYHYQPARRVVSNDNEFFTKTIVASGRQISVWVNGIQVSSYEDPREEGTDARKVAVLKAGVISLQAHDPTTNLDFRNLRVAALPKRQ
jgi:hypothetical protein